MKVENTGSILPTKKTPIKIDPWSANVVLHGVSGVGKTALLAEFGNIFFICTEDRHKHVEVYKKLITNWPQFRKYVKALEKHCPYKTVAVDTVKRLYNWCKEDVCARLGIDHPADLGHGKGWDAVRNEFAKWIVKLVNCNAGVWFVTHTQHIVIENSLYKGDTYNVNLQNQAYDTIIPICDMTLFMGYDPEDKKEGEKTKRIMVCQPIDDIEAKDSYGTLPEIINLGSNPKVAFKRLNKHFKVPSQKEK